MGVREGQRVSGLGLQGLLDIGRSGGDGPPSDRSAHSEAFLSASWFAVGIAVQTLRGIAC